MNQPESSTPISDMLSYAILKRLSHARNKLRAGQIQEELAVDRFNPARSQKTLAILQRYISFADRTILEIGCGTGGLCIAMAKAHARHVTGIDEDAGRIAAARRKAVEECVTGRADFLATDFVTGYKVDTPVDIVISENSLEHILQPMECLCKAAQCLATGGVLLAKFGPLWLSPFGAHMSGFTRVPWVHMLFPENIVLRVRSEMFRPDNNVNRYEHIDGHLNRMTVAQFKHHAIHAGFRIRTLRVNPSLDAAPFGCVNQLVNAVPILQECASHVLLAVLEKS